MLLVGGHTGEFSQPTAFNQLALAAGIGECRVIMPDKLASMLGGAPGVFFGASTSSGSLSREALGRILELSEDSDALVVGTSLSNNSDTSMFTERLISEYSGNLILIDDGLVATRSQASLIKQRPNTLFIVSMPEVFKLCATLKIPIHIKDGAGLINKLEIVRHLAAQLAGDLAVYGTETIIASGDELTVTPTNHRLGLHSSVYWSVLSSFWVQNQRQPLEGLTTGAYILQQVGANYGPASSPTVTQLADMVAHSLRSHEIW